MEIPATQENDSMDTPDQQKVEKKELTEFLVQQSELMVELKLSLNSLSKNLYKLLNDLTLIKEQEKIQHNVTKISEYTEEIGKLVAALQERIPEINEGLIHKNAKINGLEDNVKRLETVLESKNEELESAEMKVSEQKSQMDNQSAFFSAVGATLGHMIWKSCKIVDVDLFIQSGSLRDFLALSNNIFSSFIVSYKSALPDSESDEFKFFMALGGTITNISAQKSGREYLLRETVGIQLLDNILCNIQIFLMPEGKVLKRAFLMTLFNISISKKGAMHIQLSHIGVQNILNCLDEKNTIDIQTLALQLLLTLLDELPIKEYRSQLISKTPREDLKKLTDSSDANLNEFANVFSKKLDELENDKSSIF